MNDLTGRKLDVAVAKARGFTNVVEMEDCKGITGSERVFGDPPSGYTEYLYKSKDHGSRCLLDMYHEDLNACFRDLEPEMGDFRLTGVEQVDESVIWNCGYSNGGFSFIETHESPATAICLAYLEMKKRK